MKYLLLRLSNYCHNINNIYKGWLGMSKTRLLDNLSLKDFEKERESENVKKIREEWSEKAKKKKGIVSFAEMPKEAREEVARLGAIASNEKRRKTIILADTLKMLMEMPLSSEDEIRNILRSKGIEEDSLTEATAICYTQIQRAKMDSKGFEVVRDTIGQKPIDKQVVAEITADSEDIIQRHFG